MNGSQVPAIAKSVLKKLGKSKTQDVSICTTKTGYKVISEEKIEDTDHPTMQFNYEGRELPTQTEIEESIYSVFIRVCGR